MNSASSISKQKRNSAIVTLVLLIFALAFVGFPGEPFCEIGMAIRAASPFPVTCVCCHTNGHVGYLATAAAYDQGGYEPANSKLRKGVGELAQAVAIEGLQELAARNG